MIPALPGRESSRGQPARLVLARQAASGYHSDKVFALSNTGSLAILSDQVLEAADPGAVAALLARALPGLLGVADATLVLWDRKLDSFEALTPGETQAHAIRPGETTAPAPAARYLISDGQLIDTTGRGEGTLLPLMARSGLVGMLALGPRRGRRKAPYTAAEARALSRLAARAALALENHLYQQELISSERMAALGTMAGMLAHDFRGPMTIIRGYAETLLEGGLSEHEARSRAELIVEAVDRLERMTRETLDFAKGGGRVTRRAVALPAALEELAAGLAEELPGLQVVRDFQLADQGVLLDVDKLRRALGNMAANARDAMGGRGTVHLSARVEDRRLVLTLADEGPGIPPEIRERLFDPFVTHGKKAGTGLGLAVARRFVEDHGGTLELLPGGPGARFRIGLPLETAPTR